MTLLANRYRLLRPLRAGGMAAVFEAVQEDLGRRVAVKIIDGAADEEALARFRREAEAAARLGHPNIAQVTDFQTNEDEPPFLVMELLEGATLREVLRREGRLPWRRAARIGLQVLAALMAAHGARIVHRDIKPDNVFLVSCCGVVDHVKLLDFGIVKLLEPAGGKPLTRAGEVVGTLPYMAPEQVTGRDVDERTDLYALATCLYEAVSGRRPIEAPDRPRLAMAIASGISVPLYSRCPSVDRRFAAIVGRALSPRAEDRYPSAYAMAIDLAAILDETARDTPTERVPRSTPVSAPRAPNPVFLAAVALSSFLVFALSVYVAIAAPLHALRH